MKEKKTMKLGILGLGVVGAELVSQVLKNIHRIEHETGITMTIEKIYVRSLTKTRDITTDTLSLTTDVNEVIANPDIDIICECMGGNGYVQTRNYVIKAMDNGKHVVMSSKKALANYAEEILEAAKRNNVILKYDSSVGGGIPVAKVIDGAFKGEQIHKVMGIFNATSNFIYTQMEKANKTYEEALCMAQLKGYAENDPSDDVDGVDSLNKLVILILFAMKKMVHPSWFNKVSFATVSLKDMNYASELGYKIKPLAIAMKSNGKIAYKIGPCLVPAEHIVANTFNNFNSIVLEGEHCGELCFYGQGAGASPTASAMFDDLVNVFNGNKNMNSEFEKIDNIQLIEYEPNMYWRLTVKNEIGVLAKISGLLAEFQVNIEKIIQKDEVENGIEIVLLTSCIKSNIRQELIKMFQSSGFDVNACIPYL